jgi:hypothetical protein
MPSLFGVDIAQEIFTAFNGQLLTGTLTKVTPGTRTSGALAGGTNPTSVNYTFQGFVDLKSEVNTPAWSQQGGRFVTIIGNSISPAAVPQPGDSITIEGTTYKVHEVERDPAAATYTCKVEV